jgi:hypothetical protein
MRLRGKLAELMVKVAPKSTPSMSLSTQGETVLYVRLLNALTASKAALLYYQRFVADLKSIGFGMITYDLASPCKDR